MRITILQPIARYRHYLNQQSLDMLLAQPLYFNGELISFEIVSVVGFSEVARARQRVAAGAFEHIRTNENSLVFWLDADIVIESIKTFLRHVKAVMNTGAAISGRYVMRQSETMAAKLDDDHQTYHQIGEWHLTRVLAGMGALLMPANIWLDQYFAAPQCKENGREGALICYPHIIEINGGPVMISEDYHYCKTVPGGVYFASNDDGHINYGHVTERVVYPK